MPNLWMAYAAFKQNRIRIAVYLFLILILSPLPWMTGFQLIENRSFDWFSTLSPPIPEETPVILVGIDEPSFEELKLQWPWPREVHAELIDSLTTAGARVIAFDIVFAEPSNHFSDKHLAEAIQSSNSVVLASEVVVDETRYISQEIRIDALDEFIEAGASPGVAAVALDYDSVLRHLPTYRDSFAAMALLHWQQSSIDSNPTTLPENALIQYFGPSRSYPYTSYYQALNPTEFLPEGIFKNRIVIVGQAVKTSPDPGERQADAFSTSFTLSDGALVSGAEVHATIVDNLRLKLFIVQTPKTLEWLVFVVITGLCGWLLFRDWRPVRSGIYLILVLACICIASFAALRFAQLWMPPVLTITGVIMAYLSEGGVAFLLARKERREIKQAFGRYLSPALVEQLAADPSRLKLGGESRYMSIMFCDVRGFTTLSESFKDNPTGLTHIMNRFLTAMTDAVLKHGGTVDKYIGDCIMAFWNAPLDDQQHTRNASLAALAMLESLSSLNAEFQKEDARNPLHLRIGIGINTGFCVVGNIGSNQRFDYSVLGDSVNLASRLEGLSKFYGVDIVLGQKTAQALSDVALLELDRVAVKGKDEAVCIYALLGGEDYSKDTQYLQLIQQHTLMLQAYRAQEWDSAFEQLEECLATAPELLTLYSLYEQRIEAFIRQPPPKNWNGVYVAMTK